ncbi:heavy metal-responsive transcriptional regulator [Thiolapillus sp.]
MRIGEVARETGLSVDTLRYYEKIGLLEAPRTTAGIRVYGRKELSALHFIQRAKSMNFSLEEIASLLEMRADPQNARDDVRALTHRKLKETERQLEQLRSLRNELTLLVNLCRGAGDGCPIIEDLEKDSSES